MSLRAHNLACQRRGRPLFHGLNLSLSAGEALRVAGPNGSGKTSLLRLLGGLASPSVGEVRWQGQSLHTESSRRQRLYLGHASALKDDLRAWENLQFAVALGGHPRTRHETLALLEQSGLADIAELPTRALSQGQRKRVAQAQLRWALETVIPLWILDEPFAALDTASCSRLQGVLDQHLAQGGLLIYTTHQELPLQARRRLCLRLGQEVAC